MKKIMSMLVGLFAIGGANADTEASMNFDLENVKPFLSRLSKIVDSGINDQKVNEMLLFTSSVPVEDQKDMEFTVVYKGKKTPIRYSVFMDDIDAPDLYFFTSPELATAIESEMSKYSNELGI